VKPKRKINIVAILCCLFLFFGTLCFFSANWYINIFGDIGFDSILYTLLSDFKGTETGQVIKYLTGALLPTVLVTAALALLLFPIAKRKLNINIKEKIKLCIFPFSKRVSATISVVLSFVLIFTAASRVDMISYFKNILSKQSSFIEENYIDPKKVNITFPQEKHNLIVIYMESMETSFLSSEYKGGNNVNPLPELCTLAEQNLNFSHNDTVGGFSSLTGGTWTVGALVSATSGVPLKIPLNKNTSRYVNDYVLPGITTLSDILNENGYYQALMVGSDSTYGGRNQYYTQHGTDKIYDIYTARKAGIVPPDYWSWWGMEDKYLFNYAKEVLPQLAQQDSPFAFTMLTVDTHHVDGYRCEDCKTEFPEQYENALACSSLQVYEFVSWIKQQDFYKNTTIIISGDHPTMDAGFISRNIPDGYNRKVYNCFINSFANTQNHKNREFCSLDMFPTTLAAIGCKIEGERLGLGTNLFSVKPTLCEELGTDTLDKKLSLRSDYYDNEFLKLDF